MNLRKSNVRSHKQTSVSHSSTESEVTSLDAGLRMDDLPALDLWDVVIEVLHSAKIFQYGETHGETKPKGNTEKHVNRDDDELLSVDRVVTNAKPSHFEAMLYIFEGNEAVIKMTMKS